MPTFPNVKTNNISKNIINNKNKTTIQDARLNSSSNNLDSNSIDNNSWTTQTNKRNLSSSSHPTSEPPSPNPNTNIIQKNNKKKFLLHVTDSKYLTKTIRLKPLLPPKIYRSTLIKLLQKI